MKLENTLENKAKFFAQYWDQDIIMVNDPLWNKTRVVDSITLESGSFKHFDLQLTPLSQISDEDVCHICMLLVRWQNSMAKLTTVNVRGKKDGEHGDVQIVFEFGGCFHYTIRLVGNDWLGWIDSNGKCEWWTLFNIQEVNDYLRSKGYAVPYMGLSVDDLVSYGWVQLKSLK